MAERDFDLKLSDFRRLAAFIHERWGIFLPPAKKLLLEGRLRKRLIALDLPSFTAYCSYLFTDEGMRRESQTLIDLVTTNKTDFLREPEHFDFLTRAALPALAAAEGAGSGRPLRLWSAGCSTGEEPYSLAMVCSEFAHTHPGFQFEILATDISTRVLATARAAVYPEARVDPVPLAMRRRHLLRSRDRTRALVKIAPELRSRVRFAQLNLLAPPPEFTDRFDVIFCRNVIIYFDRPIQETVLHRFWQHLRPGGYLFLGHSEALTGLTLPLVGVAPTVYRRA